MMDELIAQFPEQLSKALKIGQVTEFSKPNQKIQNVVVSGMGGSGIGGVMVKDYTKDSLSVPLIVNNSYDVPSFVSSNSIVIICSYSGNTEETKAAFGQAFEKGAFIFCVSSGGTISKMAKEKGCPLFEIPPGMPPRACLGYSTVQILFGLHYCGLLTKAFVEEIQQAADLLSRQQENFKTKAKEWSEKIVDKRPIVYAGDKMKGVSVRWRQQFNENSKVVGWDNVVPEMNHNELVGWRQKDNQLVVFFLHSSLDSPRVKERMVINKEIIKKCTSNIFDIYSEGNTFWEQAFSLIHIGDWLSYYWAEQLNVDPVEVNVIDYLKGKLAETSEKD